jgi:TPR repeat protein
MWRCVAQKRYLIGKRLHPRGVALIKNKGKAKKWFREAVKQGSGLFPKALGRSGSTGSLRSECHGTRPVFSSLSVSFF